MQICYSELSVIGGNVEKNVDQLIEHGAQQIELMLDGQGWESFFERSDALVALLCAKKISYSIHVPVWDMNLTSENKCARSAAFDAYHQSIEFAARLHAEHVVIHPGFCYAPVFSKDTARRRAKEAIEALVKGSDQLGQLLLIENVGNRETSIFTQDEYIAFIKSFAGKAKAIIDIGHAYLCGWDLAETITRLGSDVCALHLHDNNGKLDQHAPIGQGSVPWGEVFEAIPACGEDLRLILEYDIGTPLEELQKGKAYLQSLFKDA